MTPSRTFRHALAAIGLAAAVPSITFAQETSMTPQKQQVVALLKSIETGDPAPVASVNPDKYIQHNLAVKLR